MITAVANAITRGGSLVNSLTLVPGATDRPRPDGSGLARRLGVAAHPAETAEDPRRSWLGRGWSNAPRFGHDHAPPVGGPNRVTEIPEHLLKRSKERRSAIGGGDAPAEEGAPAGEVEAAPAGGARRRRGRGGRRARAGPGARARAARGRRGAEPAQDPLLGPARCWPPCPCGPTCTRPPSSRPPPASSPRSRRAARSTSSAACAGCHGAGGGGQRQRARASTACWRPGPTSATT